MERREEIELSLDDLRAIFKDKFNIDVDEKDIWFYKTAGTESLDQYTEADVYVVAWKKDRGGKT